MRSVSALFAACVLLSCAPDRAHDRSLVMLAVDGMDPVLTQRWMDEGRLPHLAALAKRGGFAPLATSDPAQSPVAWSHFITGEDSDGHGIYDFLHRDPSTLIPYLSTSRAEPASRRVTVGDVSVPLKAGRVVNLRSGRPFWDALSAAGVPVTVLRVPAEYPPQPCPGCDGPPARVLSGMGTPDLLGTPGIFQLFSTDAEGDNPSGGRLHRLRAADGGWTGRLDGPPNPLSASPEALTAELRIESRGDVALVRLGAQERLLQTGEWSDWVPVAFEVPGPLGAVAGAVRLHLLAAGEAPSLYVSPVNIDPIDPAQPLSTPPGYAAQLASAVGRFYSQGMPEDTKALEAGVLSEDAFLAQSGLVWAERRAMLEHELGRFEGGFLFVYFSSVDLISHMFWRQMDEASGPSQHAIRDAYERVDAVVGELSAQLGDDAALVVMSDHGFAPYTFKVNLNERLAASGFLARRPGAATGAPLADIDWTRTRAYSVGLNLLYLNQAGREVDGIVTQAERGALLDAVERDLRAWRNPETGEPVVTSVLRPSGGTHRDRAPDLVVGYARGHRASEKSALGVLGTPLVERNTSRWSGDHCMDPREVPGVWIGGDALKAGSLVEVGPATVRWFAAP